MPEVLSEVLNVPGIEEVQLDRWNCCYTKAFRLNCWMQMKSIDNMYKLALWRPLSSKKKFTLDFFFSSLFCVSFINPKIFFFTFPLSIQR